MAAYTLGRAVVAPARPRLRLPITAGDLLLGATLVWTSIPETLTGDVYIGQVPLRFCLFYAAVAAHVISSLLTGVSRPTLGAAVALAATAYMTTRGYRQDNDLKFLVIDTSNATGLLLGLYWANRYKLQYTLNTLFIWTTSIVAVLIFTIVGLIWGFVPEVGFDNRVFSYSLFTSTAYVTWLFPLWFLIQERSRGLSAPRFSRPLAVTCLVAVLLASVVSATRSMFLSAAGAVMIVIWLKMRGRNAMFWMILTGGTAALTAIFMFSSDGWLQGVFAQRLISTEIAEEERFSELQLMFEQLDGAWLTGWGFGSRFESTVLADGDYLAVSPHVSIFTLLYKGGLITFVMLIVIPIASAVRRIFRNRVNGPAPLFAGTVLLYSVQASMSGGWNFAALFLFGAASALTLRTVEQPKPRESTLRRRSL